MRCVVHLGGRLERPGIGDEAGVELVDVGERGAGGGRGQAQVE